VSHPVQAVQRIAHDHFGVRDLKHRDKMVNQKIEFDHRKGQPGLP